MVRSNMDADALFVGSDPSVGETYRALVVAAGGLGPVQAEPKKTCVHLVARTAFAGAHPRKSALLMNIKSVRPIVSPRVRKSEQISPNCCHNEVLLAGPGEVDSEFVGWLQAAYGLCT